MLDELGMAPSRPLDRETKRHAVLTCPLWLSTLVYTNFKENVIDQYFEPSNKIWIVLICTFPHILASWQRCTRFALWWVFVDWHTETERSSGWLPGSSLETLKLVFNVSNDDEGSHPDDLSVSVYRQLLPISFTGTPIHTYNRYHNQHNTKHDQTMRIFYEHTVRISQL